MPNSMISIIVPVYNVKLFLKECIESILSQTYKEYEIILVNDGSTDGSGDICNEYSRQYPNKIRTIHKQNEGLNFARRDGFTHSKGDLVTFIDSDDVISSHYLEVLRGVMSKHHADVSVSGFLEFGELSRLVFRDECEVGVVFEANRRRLLRWLIEGGAPHNKHMYVMTAWGKLYRRSVVEAVDWDFSNYRANEDEFWTVQTFNNSSEGVAFTDARLYGYRVNEESITRKAYANEFGGVRLGKFQFIVRLYLETLGYLGCDFNAPLLRRMGVNLVDFVDIYIDRGDMRIKDAFAASRVVRKYGVKILAVSTDARIEAKVREMRRYGVFIYWLRRVKRWSPNL